MREIRWTRSATKHRVRKAQIRYVLEHCGAAFRVRPLKGEPDERLVFLGDDEDGTAVEVVAVELDGGNLLVIHAMPMREKYRPYYEEAKRWPLRRPSAGLS